MKEYETYSKEPGIAGKIDLIIEVLLGMLLVVLPLSLGGVKTWSKEMAVALSGLITICFIFKLAICPQTRLIRSWAYVPVIVFLLLAVFQLINLPAGFVRIISPNTAALRNDLLGDSAYGGSLSAMTMSFYPNATHHDLRLIISIFAVFFVVVNTYTSLPQIKRLLIIIAVTGGFAALIALSQTLFGNGKIYWLISNKVGVAYSGPFVNHNHYGQFMNLSIGAAIALLFMKTGEYFGGRKITAPMIFEYLGSSASRFFWVLTAIISIGIATVFMSLSRGGMAAIIIAAIFTTMVMMMKKSHKGHGWIMAVIALAAFACVLYTSFDAVCDRLSTLRNFNAYENRWQVLKDLTACFGQFPVFGIGLGAHSVVYPMYDSSTISQIATHAENEYAQVLEETGIIGLSMLVIFGIIIWRRYAGNISGTNSIRGKITYGLGFGLAAILFQSFTDFGQHIPANAFLSAVFCGLMVAMGSAKTGGEQSAIKVLSNWWKIPRVAVLFGAAGLFIFVIVGADNARKADAAWKDVLETEKVFVEKNWQGSDAEYRKLIDGTLKAVSYEPENIIYRYWLAVYRWRSIGSAADANGGQVWEESMPTVYAIADELDRMRFLCPTYGPPYCILGQVQKNMLDDPRGPGNIKRGLWLAPCDAIVCFVAGSDDIVDGNIEESLGKMKRAVAVDGGLFGDVAAVYVKDADRPDLAVTVAGDVIERLRIIASILDGSEEYQQLLGEIKAKIKDLLEKKCQGTDALPSHLVLLAYIYSGEKGNEQKAVELYRRAIASDYGQIRWRLDLAALLAQAGRINDAMREANICLKIQPQLQEAKQLLGELSLRQGNFVKEAEKP
jgi:O-antigen ligase